MYFSLSFLSYIPIQNLLILLKINSLRNVEVSHRNIGGIDRLLLIYLTIMFHVCCDFLNLTIRARSLLISHTFVVRLNGALPYSANICSHCALSYFECMPDDHIFLLVVQGPLLNLLICVLTADSLVNEDKNDEADDTCETEEYNKQGLLTLFLFLFLVYLHCLTFFLILCTFHFPEICLDFELKGTSLLCVNFFVDVITRSTSGKL